MSIEETLSTLEKGFFIVQWLLTSHDTEEKLFQAKITKVNNSNLIDIFDIESKLDILEAQAKYILQLLDLDKHKKVVDTSYFTKNRYSRVSELVKIFSFIRECLLLNTEPSSKMSDLNIDNPFLFLGYR